MNIKLFCLEVSMKIELFVMNDKYNERYMDPTSGPSLSLKERITAAVNFSFL